MIGSANKGIEASRLCAPALGSYNGYSLDSIPSYVTFKAATFVQKQTLQTVILLLLAVWGIREIVSFKNIKALETQLSQKEIILAPGVMDFTFAYKNKISDKYVEGAVKEFVSLMGSYSPSSIEDQIESIKSHMSNDLRVQYALEMAPIVSEVKQENIAELVSIDRLEVIGDDKGNYRAVALIKVKRWIQDQPVMPRSEVMQFDLQVKGRSSERRWFFEIQNLVRESVGSYENKKRLKKKGNK